MLLRESLLLQEALRQTLWVPDEVGLATQSISSISDVCLDGEGSGENWASAGWDRIGVKRCREYIAGRICAARALAQVGVARVACLGRTSDGLPTWPRGWIGSISHSGSWAIAVAAEDFGRTVLGVDIQTIFDAQTIIDVRQLIASNAEVQRMDGVLDTSRALTLLFSAKETLYKALYPKLRKFQDFGAAELTDLAGRHVELSLTRDWGQSPWTAGARVQLQYAWFNGLVATLAYLPIHDEMEALGN